jgi:hypothetical protein
MKKVLRIIRLLNSKLKYPPTRKIGQRVVVKVRNNEPRVLNSILQNLPLNKIKKLIKTEKIVLVDCSIYLLPKKKYN